MNLLELLRSRKNFTATEIKIADYILQHSREITKMSVNALAQETFSSNASIIRLYRKLGFSGYREFQIALSVSSSMQDEKTVKDSAGMITYDKITVPVLPLLGEAFTQAALECPRMVSETALVCAAEWIIHADRVYLYGTDCFSVLALGQMLSEFGIPAVIPDMSCGNKFCYGSFSNDVALLMPHSTEFVQKMFKASAPMRESGCRVILISPEISCDDADLIIYVPKAGKDFPAYIQTACLQTVFFYVMSALRCYILDALSSSGRIPSEKETDMQS